MATSRAQDITTRRTYYRAPTIHNVEDLECYAPGGYCPVDIDDTLEDKGYVFTVLHKLGFGPSSTIWLVKREHKNGTGSLSFHALKILRADLSAPGQHGELEMLRRMEQRGWDDNKHPNIVQIQTWFIEHSPNGQHRCFVLPLLGPSLHDRRVFETITSSGGLRERVCKKLAGAVNGLHAFEICHGNLSLRHILLKILSRRCQDPALLAFYVGPVVRETILLSNGRTSSNHSPREVVQPTTFPKLNIHSCSDNALVGLGNAFQEYPTPRTLQILPDICPPELFFGEAPSLKSDVWQLGCIMFMGLTGSFSFAAHTASASYHGLVWNMVDLLGPVPGRWQGRFCWGGEFAGWFDQKEPTMSVEDRLLVEGGLYGSEGEKVARSIQRMLAWEPEERSTSGQVYGRLMGVA